MERTLSVDASLLNDVRRYGRFDPRGCLNCGTCTLICDLSDGPVTFPRRPMQYVLVGLKDMVHESLEPWLCHDCGDCSTKCPEQSEPRESMATLRRYLTSQYDWTGLSSAIHKSRRRAVASLLAGASLFVLLVLLYHRYVVGLALSDFATNSPGVGIAHMFPVITYFTIAVFVLPCLLLASHGIRMHRMTMGHRAGQRIPLSVYLSELKTLLLSLATQRRMGKCPTPIHRVRRIKHWILAGSGALMVVVLVFFLRFFQTDALYPLYHPQRWLGYVAAAGLLFGSVDVLVGRVRKTQEMHKFSELEDYVLPVLLLLTVVTGIAVHVLRYAALPLVAHYAYLVHLVVAVPLLVVELPFGKSAHMLYRPLAIYFQSVKERAAREQRARALEAA